jgi:magnesium transporter
MRVNEQDLFENLQTLARDASREEIRENLKQFRPEDIAEALVRLDFEDQLTILQSLTPEFAGDVLVELPTQTARDLLREIPDEVAAHYLDILPVDDALELVEVLGEHRLEALLEVIPAEDAREIRQHLTYPEGSAGQLMSRDYLSATPDTTMEGILALIREAPDSIETVNYVYVVSRHHYLKGVLTVRRILRADPLMTAEEVMNSDVVSVNARSGEEEVARLMAKYAFSALPVVDDRGQMLGIITADDAQEVIDEADTEDVLAFGGVTGNADSYLSLKTWDLVKRRLPWLMILFVAETFTGVVLRNYVPTETQSAATQHLATIAKLTLFIPLLIGAGGNSGAQVTTTITRALALGELRTSDYFRVLRREMVTALIIGLTLGILGYGRALFGWNSGVGISLVVGISLLAIILWATLISSILPLAAKRVGIDPAVMSAPFISTFVDATGLIIYFEIARRILGLTYG